ncbi:MAG: alpha/beta hydrolase [Sulfurifustaceae bacterium]
MTPRLDTPIELQTAANPTAAVIWLHGLGADGSDFAGITPELGLPASAAVRFVFPHAPMRPVTINGGYVMRAWYDIAQTPGGFVQNAEDVAESVGILHHFIERERERGIPADRIVIGGFSQGGAIAIHGALRYTQRRAGAVILSAPAPYLDDLIAATSPANADLPLFWAHGRYDPVVPFAYGEASYQRLRSGRHTIEWHAYNLEHNVDLTELRDIGRFLTKVLG